MIARWWPLALLVLAAAAEPPAHSLISTFDISKMFQRKAPAAAAVSPAPTLLALSAPRAARPVLLAAGNASLLARPDDAWPVKRAAVVDGDIILGGLMMVHAQCPPPSGRGARDTLLESVYG